MECEQNKTAKRPASAPVSPAETLAVSQARFDRLPLMAVPLLDWYRENARPLPWRQDKTPYHIWVSEIMLQQTRVEAVKGYYRRFTETLPTVRHLASADEDLLLKLWEGLGYYSRARNLQRAARLVMERHDGCIPASYHQLLDLPGIGEYTAGAIASIAFGIPVPAVDGNVYRVLSRLLGSYGEISRPPVKAAFRAAAASMLPEETPGDFNQALMELGALVCLPNSPPLCDCCPLMEDCFARQGGFAPDLPVKPAKKERRIEHRTVLLVLSPKGVLLFQRPAQGLLAGLYEPINLAESLDVAGVARIVADLGGEPRQVIPLRDGKHIFSHVEWRMQGYLIYSPAFPAGEGVWAGERALAENYPVPSAFQPFLGDIIQYLANRPEE